jgi:hypothetical protein
MKAMQTLIYFLSQRGVLQAKMPVTVVVITLVLWVALRNNYD